MSDPTIFGARVRLRRKAPDLTQQDLAERAGCATVTITKIERGLLRPSRQIAELLADALRVPPAERFEFLRLARGGELEETLHASEVSEPGQSRRSLPSTPATGVQTAAPNNLPARLNPLVGREGTIEAVKAGLLGSGASSSIRLLTLIGAPGIGKSSLAIEVARRLLHTFRDGVFFVPLAPITEPDMVASTIMQSLDMLDTGKQPPLVQVKAYLKDRNALLLLDNFEQVVSAAPLLVELLSACPHVALLVTSRESLKVRGEHRFRVPPLEVPSTWVRTELEGLRTEDAANSSVLSAEDDLLGYSAVALFIERARDLHPDFALTRENAEAVVSICRRLDGLPLAIELVAARLNLFTPNALAQRLGATQADQPERHEALRLLADGPRDLPARHRTLRAAISWSYDLLTDGEKTLFRRLGVFVGGCSLAAAEAVCNAAGDLPMDILEGVSSLLDKNLIRREDTDDGELRLLMLETIREYALEQLDQSEEAGRVRRWHAEYYLLLVESAEAEMDGPRQRAWLDRLEADFDNLRTALNQCWDSGFVEMVARLAVALRPFCQINGHISEGRVWLKRALSDSRALPPVFRAQLLLAEGMLASAQGDYSKAKTLCESSLGIMREEGSDEGTAQALRELAVAEARTGDIKRATLLDEEALDLFGSLGDRRGTALVVRHLGVLAQWQGNLEEAARFYQDSLRLFRALGNKRDMAGTLNNLALIALQHEDIAEATRHHRESLMLYRQVGDKQGMSRGLNGLGMLAMRRGDYEDASTLYMEGLALVHETGDRSGMAFGNGYLGEVALKLGNFGSAAQYFKESLKLLIETGDRLNVPRLLTWLAEAAMRQGLPERAAILLGSAEALMQATGATTLTDDASEYATLLAALSSQLSEDAFQIAIEDGRVMSIEQAVDFALEPFASC